MNDPFDFKTAFFLGVIGVVFYFIAKLICIFIHKEKQKFSLLRILKRSFQIFCFYFFAHIFVLRNLKNYIDVCFLVCFTLILRSSKRDFREKILDEFMSFLRKLLSVKKNKKEDDK